VTAKIVRTISLTTELMPLIGAEVAIGLYDSASEVVRADLRLLAEQDRREEQLAKTAAESERDAR
jgi:putative addiction module CopG family antidote